MKLALAIALFAGTVSIGGQTPTLPAPPQEAVVHTEGMPNEADIPFDPQQYLSDCNQLVVLYKQLQEFEADGSK